MRRKTQIKFFFISYWWHGTKIITGYGFFLIINMKKNKNWDDKRLVVLTNYMFLITTGFGNQVLVRNKNKCEFSITK